MKTRRRFEPIEFQPRHTFNPRESRDPLPMSQISRPSICVAHDHSVF